MHGTVGAPLVAAKGLEYLGRSERFKGADDPNRTKVVYLTAPVMSPDLSATV